MTDGVDASDVVPGLTIDPGQAVLVTGPPMTGKQSLALDLLGASFGADDAALVISTMRPVSEALSTLRATTGASPAQLRGVDCSRDETADQQVSSVASPSDLTGIGMHADRHLGELADSGYQPRVGLVSVSTMLPLTEFQPVYRFLHVLTGRTTATDSICVVVLDSEAHDEQVVAAFTSLFDRRIQLRDDADGREVRVVGTGGETGEWRPLAESEA
jgi:KaiC/GvpD/RAD55 family RecA-like ATPase